MNNVSERHPDRDSYLMICEQIIEKEIGNYQELYPNDIKLIPNWQEEVWECYVRLNQYCKVNYMKSSSGKIDRHKVAACYMIAISTVKPLRFEKKDDKYYALNESLAITVGLSLIRAFVIAAVKDNKNISQKDADKIIAKFENGIKVPDGDLVNHGRYLDNFASEIYFGVAEGSINLLSVAHELYLLEVLTRLS